VRKDLGCLLDEDFTNELIAIPQFDAGRWNCVWSARRSLPLSSPTIPNHGFRNHPALAALSGQLLAALLRCTSWLSQQTQAKVQARATSSQREELYKHSSKKPQRLMRFALLAGGECRDITQLVDLYALVSMMRVISSTPIVESANQRGPFDSRQLCLA